MFVPWTELALSKEAYLTLELENFGPMHVTLETRALVCGWYLLMTPIWKFTQLVSF